MIKTLFQFHKPKHPPTANWYKKYILSPEWREKRQALKDQRGDKCEDCDQPSTILHHITYARVRRELPEDLRFLCDECHRKAHQLHDIPYLFYIYWSWKKIEKYRTVSRITYPISYPRFR